MSSIKSHQRLSFIKCRFETKVVFNQRLSSIQGRLPSKVILHQRSSSFKGCLPSKVLFHQRLSSIKGCLPSKVVFHQRSSSIKGHFPSKVVFQQRLSLIKVFLASNVILLVSAKVKSSSVVRTPGDVADFRPIRGIKIISDTHIHTQTNTESTYCQALLYEQRLQKLLFIFKLRSAGSALNALFFRFFVSPRLDN